MILSLTLLFLLLQAADLLTTRFILSRGGRELNPIGRAFHRYGTPGLAALKAITSSIFLLCAAQMPPQLRLAALTAACAVYAAVLLFNLRGVRSARRRR